MLENRENQKNNKIEERWYALLDHANKQIDIDDKRRSNEILHIFHTNLEKNQKWKKRWYSDLYFLKTYKSKGNESNFKTQQMWNDIIATENDTEADVCELGVLEKNIFKDEEKQFELWNKTNWWKQW